MIKQFIDIMSAPPFDPLGGVSDFAVAVSGGPDSMALAKLLSDWSAHCHGPNIHCLTVDHGLRPEAAEEAEQVKQAVSSWPKVSHTTLVWEGEKPSARIQEEARAERYRLMEEYCGEHGIGHLFLAHHGDDQIETFMFRLAKGSGLDGLCGMKPIQQRGAIYLCRPFLQIFKDDLVSFCECENIPYITDPSNQKDDFARVRIRKLVSELEEEGLSFKRLTTTMSRLDRARESLDNLADKLYKTAGADLKSGRIVFDCKALSNLDFELLLRVVKKAMDELAPCEGYGPRTEKLESLVSDFMNEKPFRKRTLGGVVFEISKDGSQVILEKENKSP